ncbi:MAG: methionyl-tRNA formyltransferase [Candidatus Yanofskybacteria bacterium]|nr:methionyl-tRNA formyltransferase [Candidatus Yanofskybacteria bacterium]
MKNNLKIVFFGTPDFAMPVLEALKKNSYNVFHLQQKSLKDELVFEEFKSLKPDICIVAAYGKIIPQKFLDIPQFGFINIHPSLLPKYRGPSPIQTAILNEDQEAGVSIIVMDAEIDHGPLLAKREFSIFNFKFSNHSELAKELFELGAKLLIETLPKYIAGEIKIKEQDHSQATFTKMFSRDDGRINWNQPCEKIYNQIRALNPEPGTWTMWKGKILNIHETDIIKEGWPEWACLPARRDPGRVEVSRPNPSGVRRGQDPGHVIVVATKTCYLILKSIQLEGGKKMDAKSFVNGHPDFLGSRLE